MFNTIYILQWDNYYDRRVHPDLIFDSNGGLGYYLEYDTGAFPGVNFNPNDHINTEITLNLNETQLGSYAIVLDENNKIVSRWFITEAVRIRGNQYRLSLHRDVITDYWNIIQSAPALIEKCNLNYDNPLIFNSEDMTVNQIKTSETLLKDRTECPWLVMYIDKTSSIASDTASVGSDLESSAILINDTIEDWEAEHSTFYGAIKNINYNIYLANSLSYIQLKSNASDASYKTSASATGSTLKQNVPTWNNLSKVKKGLKQVGAAAVESYVPAYAVNGHSAAEVESFLTLNGKTIKDTNGRYYSVTITESKSETVTYNVASGSLYNKLTEVVNASGAFSGSPNSSTFRVSVNYNTYKTVLTRLYSMELTYSVSGSRISTTDAAYDILAIPYGRIYAGAEIGSSVETNAEIGLAVANAIAKKLQEACYDIQLVPYCPLQDYIVQRRTVNTASEEALTSFITTGENNEKVGVIYNVPKANFTFDILEEVAAADSPIGRKVNNDCDKWRIASPNYSNYFDFSVEKNNGVEYFNVDCCYKPYTPYIHINPNFNGLYGQDFNDPRGLVCGGDFSLTQVRDAWESYKLQNKNFQATFDRQIQNMEFTNKYQRAVDITSAIAGTVQGGVSGAATGTFASGMNPILGGIGAGVGTAASAAGGIADVVINEQLRGEAINYAIDQFGYQLGNIQAMPLTLTKVDAFNHNNKIFPVLEYYTCTDREKEAYAQKVAYNGMTNMTIDTIENYLDNSWEYEINNKTIKSQNYIKAKPIHILLEEDFHMANAIAKEMNLGFYIVKEE